MIKDLSKILFHLCLSTQYTTASCYMYKLCHSLTNFANSTESVMQNSQPLGDNNQQV